MLIKMGKTRGGTADVMVRHPSSDTRVAAPLLWFLSQVSLASLQELVVRWWQLLLGDVSKPGDKPTQCPLSSFIGLSTWIPRSYRAPCSTTKREQDHK